MGDRKNRILMVVAGVIFVLALAAFFWPRGGPTVPEDVKKAAAEGDKVYEEELSKQPGTTQSEQPQPTFTRKARPAGE